MPASTDIREGIAEAFEALGAEFFENVMVTLCKSSTSANEFVDVLNIGDEIGPVWIFEYSEFRQNFLLQIAADDAALTNAIAEATHVQVDNDYYVIRNGDTLPPKGTDPTWKLFCDRFTKRDQISPLY